MVLGLLSNSFGTDPFDPYAHCGIWDLFDVHVISEREGVAKPDPAIYQRAVDRMQLPAQDCVFVDNNPVNLPPAGALGRTTIHATDQADTVRRLAATIGVPADPTTKKLVGAYPIHTSPLFSNLPWCAGEPDPAPAICTPLSQVPRTTPASARPW